MNDSESKVNDQVKEYFTIECIYRKREGGQNHFAFVQLELNKLLLDGHSTEKKLMWLLPGFAVHMYR